MLFGGMCHVLCGPCHLTMPHFLTWFRAWSTSELLVSQAEAVSEWSINLKAEPWSARW